jgi:3-phosphoshikimate 1-carboxyvinyltransferase
MQVQPAKKLLGRLSLPGDKSLSHRHLIRAALVKGESHIRNLSTAEDVQRSATALEALGVRITQSDGVTRVQSPGYQAWTQPPQTLDCGNSGTTARLFMGLLAGRGFRVTLDGDASLRKRPMLRCARPLQAMGARFEFTDGHLPIEILPAKLHAEKLRLEVPSAQVKSAILLAALSVKEETHLLEPLPCRDHTERLLGLNPEIEQSLGLQVDSPRHWVASIKDCPNRPWTSAVLPGDPSSAIFFVVAALLLEDSELEIDSLLLNPFRSAYLEWLEENGAALGVREEPADAHCGPRCCSDEGCDPKGDCPIGESFGTLFVRSGEELEMPEVSGSIVPRLIDELPALAALALGLGKPFLVRGAQELRLKESDRIRGICRMARAFGAEATELLDGFEIKPLAQVKAARFDCDGDHRLAMAAWVLALKADGPSELIGTECVEVSLPEFQEYLDALIRR